MGRTKKERADPKARPLVIDLVMIYFSFRTRSLNRPISLRISFGAACTLMSLPSAFAIIPINSRVVLTGAFGTCQTCPIARSSVPKDMDVLFLAESPSNSPRTLTSPLAARCPSPSRASMPSDCLGIGLVASEVYAVACPSRIARRHPSTTSSAWSALSQLKGSGGRSLRTLP